MKTFLIFFLCCLYIFGCGTTSNTADKSECKVKTESCEVKECKTETKNCCANKGVLNATSEISMNATHTPDYTPIGACVYITGYCELDSEKRCSNRGGEYQGDGTEC